jgi:ubiquinone/menaquinone biosynthesis C-methylase UbiE
MRDTRASYNTIAATYTERFGDALDELPLDRAVIGAFAELVRHSGHRGPVADIGCGPGSTTARLRELGLSAFGVDLSPEMIAIARRRHPELRYEVGSMTALEIPDGSLAGLMAWYSVIHIPDEQLPGVIDEFHRVLAPGGQLLIAFQMGDEPVYYAEGFGHQVSLTFHRRQPDQVAGLLDAAGLPVHARLVREPEEGRTKTQQAYLLAEKMAEKTVEGAG